MTTLNKKLMVKRRLAVDLAKKSASLAEETGKHMDRLTVAIVRLTRHEDDMSDLAIQVCNVAATPRCLGCCFLCRGQGVDNRGVRGKWLGLNFFF